MQKLITSFFCIFIVLGSPVLARDFSKSVFLISNVTKNYSGSCVAIGYSKSTHNLLVLSAGHIVSDRKDIFLTSIENKLYYTKPIAYIYNIRLSEDISLMEVFYKEYVPLINTSNNDKFMTCRLIGYPYAEGFNIKNGIFLSMARNTLYSIEGVSVPGMSGGAVVNESGKLVGIIVGHINNQISVATNINFIRKFLKIVLPEGYLTSIPLNKIS